MPVAGKRKKWLYLAIGYIQPEMKQKKAFLQGSIQSLRGSAHDKKRKRINRKI